MGKKENYNKNTKKSDKVAKNEENEKISWKAGNMLYPLPAVMVSLTDKEGRSNIITLAWAGTICTNPPMLSVSIRPERYSYDIIKETGEFVVNLTTKALTRATDYCGVTSGRNVDKFKKMKLTKLESEKVKAVAISESPVNIECKLRQVMELGSHSLFIADVVNVRVDGKYMDDKGRFNLKAADLIAYSHGRYYELGKELGSFGYSIKKTKSKTKKAETEEKGGLRTKANLEGSKRDTKKREDKSKTIVGKKVKGRRKVGGLKE